MRRICALSFIISIFVSVFLCAQEDLPKEKKPMTDLDKKKKPITDKIRLESRFYGKYLYTNSKNEKILYSVLRDSGKFMLKIETPITIYISQFSKFEDESVIFYHFESLPKENIEKVAEEDKNLPDEVLLNIGKDRKALSIKQKTISGETSEVTALKFVTHFGKNPEIIDQLFPLEKGYKYVYKKIINGETADSNPTITLSIEEKKFSSIGDRYTFAMELPDGKIVKKFYGKTKSGFYRYDEGGPNEGFKMFPFPLRIDSQWETGKVIKKNEKLEIVQMLRAVEGIDYLVTTEGVIECFKVKENVVDKLNGEEINYIWVAPAIGIVQFSFEEGKGQPKSIYRLIRFSYGNNTIFPK